MTICWTTIDKKREEFIPRQFSGTETNNKAWPITRTIWVSCSAYAEASADTVVALFAFAPAPQTAL